MKYDVFISHASEDKIEVAKPLALMLEAAGLRVWLDAFELKLGDSIRRSIDHGLAESKFGVVILSPNFFRKEWPQRELDGLFAKDDGKQKVLLPVWHRVDRQDVAAYSPVLADRLAVSTELGIEEIAQQVTQAILNTKPARDTSLKPQAEENRLIRTIILVLMGGGTMLCPSNYKDVAQKAYSGDYTSRATYQRVYTFTISPYIADREFGVIMDRETNSYEIDVSRKGSDFILQTLTHPELELSSFFNAGLHDESLIVKDLDFDGYTDLMVLTSISTSGRNRAYMCWKYDSNKDKFIFNRGMTDVCQDYCDLELNSEAKEIRVWSCFSLGDWWANKYKFQNGKYILASENASDRLLSQSKE